MTVQTGYGGMGHVLRRRRLVKKCMHNEVEGVKHRDGPKITWQKVDEGDMRSLGLDNNDTMHQSNSRGLVGGTIIVSDNDGC